eukprot:GHVQ01028617.1.p1 GENE.GHVQ01028617.1~~GHVQ01028617.1.p1  ORF type:complete len:383 (+),score=67.94 GHVQ01028617.1:219-1367(+)
MSTSLHGFDSVVPMDSRSKNLVEFRAGKIAWDGSRATPDKRKGKISLCTGTDDLLHFRWTNRESGRIEDDLIVINDAYLEKVPEAKTGRIYVLRFSSSEKKFLFWMQEPEESEDEERINNFNKHAGGAPPAKPSNSSPPASCSVTSTSSSTAASKRLSTLSESTSSSVSESSTTSSVNQTVSQLLNGTSDPPPAIAAGLSSTTAAQLGEFVRSLARQNANSRTPPVSVSEILTPARFKDLMNDPEALNDLRQHLPPGHDSDSDMEELIRSSQLQATMSNLSQAVYSDQLPVILSSMGLPSTSNSSVGDNMERFVNALEASSGASASSGRSEKKKDDSECQGPTDTEGGEPPLKKNKTEEEDGGNGGRSGDRGGGGDVNMSSS